MFDGAAFGQEMVAIVRGYVATELEPLRAENAALRAENKALAERLAALEAREMPEAIKGDPGEVDMDAVREIVDELTQQAVGEQLAEAIKALPPPEKGEPGRDVDMEEVGQRIEAAIKSAIEALPAPKDGEPGKDGLGLANALIDRSGCLVVTFTDGSDKNLGQVVGKDGENGKDGETFTLDDFDIEPLDERTIKLKFAKGEVVHSFELAFPVPVYRGVFKDGESYERGDMVTWGGDLWHAERATSQKPATDDWRLAVRKGRDAKP